MIPSKDIWSDSVSTGFRLLKTACTKHNTTTQTETTQSQQNQKKYRYIPCYQIPVLNNSMYIYSSCVKYVINIMNEVINSVDKQYYSSLTLLPIKNDCN